MIIIVINLHTHKHTHKGKSLYTAALDLSKAFDTIIDIYIYITNLALHQVWCKLLPHTPTPPDCLTRYILQLNLITRLAYINNNLGLLTQPFAIERCFFFFFERVPQGPILSPFIFTMAINNVLEQNDV